MKFDVYVGNGEYVDTIDTEDGASDSDILEIAMKVVLEWVENSLYWEPQEN